MASEGSFEKVITVARDAFNSRKSRPISFRRQQLKNFLRMLKDNWEAMQNAVGKDLRKNKHEVSLYELESVRHEATVALKNLNSWTSPDKLPFNALLSLDAGYIEKTPFGLVLIMSSWNYPIMLSLQPMIGAIAAGNCVILKPSEVSHNVSTLLAKMLPEYLDRECYHVVQGGPEETTQLLTHKFDYVFYTGSTGVGRLVMTAASHHLTPVTLELGGKSPCYVDDAADMEIAAKRVLWGTLLNMGQTCVAPDYVLCSKRVEATFLKVAAGVLEEWYGNNLQTDSNLSRIINEKHCLRLKALLDTTRGRIALGGTVDIEDLYVAPTIVVDVTPDDPLMEGEIFGPILPIVTVNSVDEAIKFINSRPRPLALYTFSKNAATNKRVVSETVSGGVCVNDCLWQVVWNGLPFGGVGDSGMGNYHGKSSFDTFSHHRSVLDRSLSPLSEKLGEARYPPYTDGKTGFLTFVSTYFTCFDIRLTGFMTHFFAFALGVAIILLCHFLHLF